jgi:hypothetical protein
MKVKIMILLMIKITKKVIPKEVMTLIHQLIWMVKMKRNYIRKFFKSKIKLLL